MKFFVLKNPKTGETDAVTDFLPVVESPVGEAPQCKVCGEVIGLLPLVPPIRLELEAWGTRWGDVAFGTGNQILISSRLKRLFVDAGLVGFTQFDPVEVVRVKTHKRLAGAPPGYELASIQRSRAAIDDESSGLERDAPWTCEECRIDGPKRTERIVLEPNTWSGEDVFIARGLPGRILTSEQFWRLCVDNDLANCCLVEAEKFAFDFYPQERPTLR